MPIPEAIERRIDGAVETAFLATAVDDRPHVAPVWYRYVGGDVLELTTTGRKLANLRQNPRVAIAIEASEDGIPEWAVTLFGTANVVEDPAETERVAHAIDRKYGVEPGSWPENTLVRVDVASATTRE